MCPICRKKILHTKVAVGKGEEVHPECYEAFLLFVEAIEAIYAEKK